jgi:hypothetical protein
LGVAGPAVMRGRTAVFPAPVPALGRRLFVCRCLLVKVPTRHPPPSTEALRAALPVTHDSRTVCQRHWMP